MIAVLDQALKERHTARESELWRMRKGDRVLRCVTVYTAAGLDLRLFAGQEMLRTELFETAPVLRARADSWRTQLNASGWTHEGSAR
jgi:hypothetical protein